MALGEILSVISKLIRGLTAIYTPPLARLIEQLQKLPGVGPKSAQRLALYILKRPEQDAIELAQAIVAAKKQVGLCQVCFHLSAEPICEICRNPNRETGTICVVADSVPKRIYTGRERKKKVICIPCYISTLLYFNQEKQGTANVWCERCILWGPEGPLTGLLH